MALSSQSYQKVERKQFAQSVRKITPENEYWNAFKSRYQDRFHLNVPFLRFSPTEPYDCAVCSHYDVRLFRSSTFQTYKKLGFKAHPLVADIRRDTKLLAVGGKGGLFRIYNNANSSGLEVMRSLKGHRGDIHQIKFQPSDTTRIASFSNDQTCGYWDIITPTQLTTINGHTDFIRSGDWISTSESCIISGSYDHFCKLWDLRDVQSTSSIPTTDPNTITHQCQTQFNHAAPIECCLSIPNSDLIAIGGGPKVTIWSLRKPNKPLTTIEVHRKSVTCLSVNASGSRLLTGCLDNHVRVFTTSITGDSMFKNSHAFTTPSAILALDMSANDMMIAIGTLNHGIIVRAREGHNKSLDKYLKVQQYEDDPIAKYDEDIREWMESNKKLSYMTHEQAIGQDKYVPYGSRDWVIRGQKLKLPSNMRKQDVGPQTQQLQLDDVARCNTMVVRFKNRKKMKQYDIALKQFRYSDALDFALKAKDTLTVHSVMEDLWRRDGLEIALGGRDSERLSPILEYLIYALPHPHLSQTALHVAAIVIDSYQSIVGLSDDVDYLFKTMAETVNNMVAKYKILLKLQGSLDMILSAQDIAANQLPQKMLNLAEKMNQIMEKTKLKYESSSKDDVKRTPDKMEMD
eukprot:147398_1